MVNHPNRSKFNHKVEYPVAVEELVNGKWIETKRFKTQEAAQEYCEDVAFVEARIVLQPHQGSAPPRSV